MMVALLRDCRAVVILRPKSAKTILETSKSWLQYYDYCQMFDISCWDKILILTKIEPEI